MSRILLVDDDPGTRETLSLFLRRAGLQVQTACTGDEGLHLGLTGAYDVILLDDFFPVGRCGRDVIRELRQAGVPAPIVIISGLGTPLTGFEAARLGAVAYLEKPIDGDQLVDFVRTTLASAARCHQELVPEVDSEPLDGAACLLGGSPGMRWVRALIRRIAPADGALLIEGETGTGKELAARAVHDCSRRRAAPFVPVNCAAMPESLIDSELFGHGRGAFTGAVASRVGLIESADGGTLFLDELPSLPLCTQARLLRVLESGEVRRVGENTLRHVNVRVVGATNSSLPSAIDAGLFRADLMYRLNTLHVPLPPLRERREDIQLLAQHL